MAIITFHSWDNVPLQVQLMAFRNTVFHFAHALNIRQPVVMVMQDDHLPRGSLKDVHETRRSPPECPAELVSWQYSAVTYLSGCRILRGRNPPGPNRQCRLRAYSMHDRTYQEKNPMQKSSIMMLIASSILIAGILVAGCTDSSSSVDTSSTLSPIPSLSKSDGTTPVAAADAGDKHQFNESASQAGTRPEGMEMNRYRPCREHPRTVCR